MSQCLVPLSVFDAPRRDAASPPPLNRTNAPRGVDEDSGGGEAEAEEDDADEAAGRSDVRKLTSRLTLWRIIPFELGATSVVV